MVCYTIGGRARLQVVVGSTRGTAEWGRIVSTEYRVTLTAQSALQGSSVSIHDGVWCVAQYGLGHIGKIVSVLVEDSARKQVSWDRWVDAIGTNPTSSVEWGTWVETFGNDRTYISAMIEPVDIPESEWAGLGER